MSVYLYIYIYIYRISSNSSRGLLISPFALCAVNSRARYIRGRGRIVRVRSINFTVCVMHGLFESAVYSEGANYSRKYGIYIYFFIF